MKKIYNILFAVVSLFMCTVALGRDTHAWLILKGEGDLTKNIRFKAEEQFKFNKSRLFADETLFLVGWQPTSFMSFWGGHRIVRERNHREGHLQTEQRPTFDIYLIAPEFWTLKIDFRSRFELRDKTDAQVYMRYRERLRVRTSWSVSDFKISPYASEELFFSDKPGRDDADLWDRSRTQVGVTFRPIPSIDQLACSAWYMIQYDMSNNSSVWSYTPVWGLSLTYRF